MSEDPLEAMVQAAADDGRDGFQQRVEKQRRAQNAARATRRVLRASIVLLLLAGFGLIWFDASREIPALVGIALLCLLLALVIFVVLFLMGGVAPTWIRPGLSDRAKRSLDD